jgi:signal transduction histidine kinase/DNA-binding response OmpR family regulator
MNLKTRTKVIVGFVLAGMLIIGVSTITYISVTSLMNSVESLSKPNERLLEYNELISDIYKLDQARQLADTDEPKDTVEYYDRIKERIEILKQKASDSLEIRQLESIDQNVKELLIVFENLREVNDNISNRDFNEEALQSLEKKLKRQEERAALRNLSNLGSNIDRSLGIQPRASESAQDSERDYLDPATGELQSLLDLLESHVAESEKSSPRDSIMNEISTFFRRYSSEERSLRSRLAFLQQQLTMKNKDIILTLQSIISSLQNEALQATQRENEAAYQLTYKLTLLLALLILVGVFGSAAFILSIIKEIRKSEVYHQQLREAKLKSEKLAKAKQDFLASMSHEIRNPLHVIQGYTEVLKKTSCSNEQMEYLEATNFATETLLGVVNDILDFSKLEAGKIKMENDPFCPFQVVNNCIGIFKQKANKKGLELKVDLTLNKELWLRGDKLRICQVLTNLLSNAIKFTEKGWVSVQATYTSNGILQLEVRDTGIGIDKKLQKELFTEFFQGESDVARKFGGTGLGLAIVKKLVHIMNGEIQLESEYGVGSCFKVMIPLEETSDRAEILPDEYSYSLEGKHILLVDDDEIVLRFTTLLLKSLGAKVTSFLGGVAFRNNFNPEAYDLAMIDIQMPEVSGYEVMHTLREEGQIIKSMPILAVTANVFAKEGQSIQEKGFDGIILKPFKENELLSQIASYIDLAQKKIQPMPTTASNNIHEESVPQYDLSDVEKYCMGDQEMLEELVKDFCTQTHSDLIQLNTRLNQMDHEAVQSIAHKLASRLKQFKIAYSDMAKEIEENLKKGKTDEIAELVKALTINTYPILEQMLSDFNIPIKLD